MITFNDVLHEIELDPKEVQLVRHHSAAKTEFITTPYKLWQDDRKQFEHYQRLQRRNAFSRKYLASFVATPEQETLFVGLYRVNSEGVAGKTKCPVSGKDCTGSTYYDIELDNRLHEYVDRLTIKWSGRTFIQYAYGKDGKGKDILEIRSKPREEEWPGFSRFSRDLRRLKSIPKSWQETLTRTQGIYLLACQKTGKKYVGSAKSEDGGFWQRFRSYENGKHGGNKELKTFDMSHMLVSILELVDPGTAKIVQIENAWKDKLLTRKRYPFGLNAN